MFSNLFMYFGPMWSAALLLGVVVLPFCLALAETLRLILGSHRPCVAFIRLVRFRQRLTHSLATAYVNNTRAVRRLSGAADRFARRR